MSSELWVHASGIAVFAVLIVIAVYLINRIDKE